MRQRPVLRSAIALGVIGLWGLMCGGSRVLAAEAEVRWDMASFARLVRPMRHSLDGRLPLLAWNFPLPRGDALVRMRQDGTLRAAIHRMAERGFIPTVEMGWEWTREGALAMARTLQEAGQPVHLLIPTADLLERAYKNTDLWIVGPDASARGALRKWPCLPLADPTVPAGMVRQLFEPYRAAGIGVRGVWFDDEALPHPWNGVHLAQRLSPGCRSHYPPGVVDDWQAFLRYTYDLRSRLLSEALADPVHAIFQGALAGNYFEAASSDAVPFVDTNGARYPARSLGRLDAAMPSAYANTAHLPRYFKAGEPVTEEKADRVHFHLMLRAVSTANANKAPGKLSIPFLSRLVVDNPDARFRFGLTPRRYRELIWHVLLRGSDGLYLFNLGYPGSPVTPAESFESLEAARSVYDELLGYREFLAEGEPMNYEVPPMHSTAAIWSGLRLKNRWLVRAFTLGPEPQKVQIDTGSGARVVLDAPPDGATYLIRADDRPARVIRLQR